MGNIGRVRVNLHDAIGTQIDKTLKRAGISDIKSELEAAAKQSIVITQMSNNPDVIVSSDPDSSAGQTGYDYSTAPPTSGYSYLTSQERIDNIDTLLLSQIIELAAIQSQLTSIGVWYTVAYIPITTITQINLPHPITIAKVWKNGLRLYEGAGYDFTISGSSVLVAGIANDRFIVEYTTSWVGS